MIRLGVNIDHVATVRQARRTIEPDPVHAAVLAELGGADGITVHLREDRRHIQDHDVSRLRSTIHGTLNLEMALDESIAAYACELKPHYVCLVPEKREELTTEGGLDISHAQLPAMVTRLQAAGIGVSLFIDPNPEHIDRAKDLGADAIELHTGAWAEAWLAHHSGSGAKQTVHDELHRLEVAAARAAATVASPATPAMALPTATSANCCTSPCSPNSTSVTASSAEPFWSAWNGR